MSTFDGWETHLYGDALALPGQPSENVLMHFRTKGSKNGVRRYQQPDGTWTPLGLKERKAREGWGETRAQKKAEKLQRKSERRERRKERFAAAKEAYNQRKLRNSLKGLSDDELKAKIERLKLEKEYKELNKNPAVEMGAKIVKAYFDMKGAKLKRDTEKANLIVRQQEALAKLKNAEAAKLTAKNDILDNIVGGKGRMKAKAELLKSKRQNTIRGAVGEAVGNVIKKEGTRLVNEMGSQSRILKTGRAAKNAAKKGFAGAKFVASEVYTGAKEGYKQGRREAQQELEEERRRRRRADQYVSGSGTVR